MPQLKTRTPLRTLLLIIGLSWAVYGAAETPEPVTVEMTTNNGVIVLELLPEYAPETVKNFLAYMDSGHYDGLIFHRVIPDFMIQGGGVDSRLLPRKTRAPIVNEAASGLRNMRGTIAMARTANPDSATSQFFINLSDNNFLDYGFQGGAGYAVFGRVVEGIDVVDRIAKIRTRPMGPHQNVPVDTVVIERVRVREAAAAE